MSARLPQGIRRRHARTCPARDTDDMAVCRCRPGYQAQAGPRGARQTRTHRTLAAATAWKRDTDWAYATGQRTVGRAPTVRQAAEEWIRLADAGVVLARGGRAYSPSTLRGYRQALAAHVYQDAIADVRIDQLTSGRVNAFVEGLQARGLAAQTVKNALIPLRAVYRRQLRLGKLTANPTKGADVPAGSGRRLRFLAPGEIPLVLAPLDRRDRALWATAIYAGLRRGELMGLRWSDVDLASGVIRPHQSYDAPSGSVKAIKSDAGQDRRVPIIAVLRDELAAHRARAHRASGLVFSRASLADRCRAASRDLPFSASAVALRARRAWAAAGAPVVTLHECRHTFASLMIAAYVDAGRFDPKAIQHMLGHASITQTYDRYGHLFPGTQAESGQMLSDFLDRAASLPSATPTDSVRDDRQVSVPRTARSGIR